MLTSVVISATQNINIVRSELLLFHVKFNNKSYILPL